MSKPREKNKIKGCSDLKKAWEILDEAYGDEDRIVETLINDLDSIDTYEVKGKINLTAMEKFVENLQNFSTQMESLGIKGELNSRVILAQVRRKLPEEHRISYIKDVRDNKANDTASGLVQWLHSHMVLLQKAKLPMTNTKESSPKPTRYHGSTSHSTMSPGGSRVQDVHKRNYGPRNKITGDQLLPKCPLHPQISSHYLKGCNKFRSLSQGEKFDVMRTHHICQRCGHNNCVAGKYPFDCDNCQFFTPCQIPTWGVDTHFSSICPRVYGTDGYRHFEKRQVPSSGNSRDLNAGAREFHPTQKTCNQIAGVPSMLKEGNVISCALPTLMGYIRHGSKRTLVRALLDTGSQVSLIREGIIPKSNCEHMQDYSLTTVGGDVITRKLRVVECVLESLDGTFNRNVRLAEMRKPCGDAPIITNAQIQHYPHLADIEVMEAPHTTIDVLLGVENGDILVPYEHIVGPDDDGPIASRYALGWCVQGGRGSDGVTMNTAVNFTQVTAISEIEDFLGIERMGIEPKHCKCAEEKLNRNATNSMQQSIIRLEDGAYQLGLPWRKPPHDLPNNYDYALRRFLNLEKRFAHRPKDWEIYCKQMNNQLERGVARLVPQCEMEDDTENGRTMWFLPHFAVQKESDTTPVRVVYDGKARYQGHSLNDYLAKGDNMGASLFEVALRFREYEVGVVADISKMFQAVKMTPDDSRYHRFVFRQNPDEPIQVYELTTVTFGDKSSPTAATIALRHVASEHGGDDSEIHRVINHQFYVDDLNDSQRSVNDVQNLKSKLTTTLEKGNFKIRKWLSNEREICDPEYYPVDDQTVVLGTQWNVASDTLSVKAVKTKVSRVTKRNILKKTASYYDIFGMLSGVLVRPKILLQKLWQFDMDWDTPINPDSDLFATWEAIERDLPDLHKIEIKRCLIPDRFRGSSPLPQVSLHGASDASEDAMGMGVWLRWSDGNEDHAHLTFVCPRARLTPLKQSSMPRKELQTILLLARLMLTVKNALRLGIDYARYGQTV